MRVVIYLIIYSLYPKHLIILRLSDWDKSSTGSPNQQDRAIDGKN